MKHRYITAVNTGRRRRVTARDTYRWSRRFGFPRWQALLKALMN